MLAMRMKLRSDREKARKKAGQTERQREIAERVRQELAKLTLVKGRV